MIPNIVETAASHAIAAVHILISMIGAIKKLIMGYIFARTALKHIILPAMIAKGFIRATK